MRPRCVINIGADALLKFFSDRQYKNTYDLAAPASQRPFPLVGATHQVSERRRLVDELIGFPDAAAHRLYFGAVALSGSGIRFYGEYCLVLSDEFVRGQDPQVLDRNSYDLVHPPLRDRVGSSVPPAVKVEVKWLCARWNDQLSDLLIMKVAPTIDTNNRLVTPGAVAEGILADEDFAEVHLKESFGPDQVEEIRFAPEEQSLASDLQSRMQRRRPLDAAEWLWLWRRNLVDVACDENHVRRRVTTAAGRTRRWQ